MAAVAGDGQRRADGRALGVEAGGGSLDVGAGIAQTVVAPFTAGVRALLYIDRRMRAEGLDVSLMAAVATSPS